MAGRGRRRELTVPRLPVPRGELGLRDGYHSPQVDVEVRLNTNESPSPPPPGWLEAWRSGLGEVDWHRYPDRTALRLREAIADHHGVRVDQVFAANGSNEVIQAVCLAFGGAGRSAAVFEPTYALHSHIAHLTGTGVSSGVRGPDLRLDLAHVPSAIEAAGASVVFACTPNNPTGLAETPEAVASVVAAAESVGGLAVVDEAYGQFASWSALGMVDDDVPMVVTRTFSKTWSLASLRLGYLVGPAGVVAALERVALPYHLDAAKQLAGRLAVGFAADMERSVAEVVSERDRLCAALRALGAQVWDSEANFLLFKIPGRRGGEVWEGLLERSVLVRDTGGWVGLEDTLRVTVGSRAECDRFLRALSEVCALDGPGR